MPAKTNPSDKTARHDVIVLGAGLAAMSTAIQAKQLGADVVVLEKAPEGGANGNSKFSGGGFRAPEGDYTQDVMREEYLQISRGRANPRLTEVLVTQGVAAVEWLKSLGVKFDEDISIGRPDFQQGANLRHHATGDGYQMMLTLMQVAERMKIPVLFEHAARSLIVNPEGRVVGVRVLTPDGFKDFLGGAVVVATGGFEANTEMRVRYCGRWADGLIVRGSKYNTGDGLRMCLEAGALPAGQWGDYHSAVIDKRSEILEAGETNINTYPLTILVNQRGERFVDEGQDYFDKTYVAFGKAILDQPGGYAVCVYDVKLAGKIFGSHREWKSVEAWDLRNLAQWVKVDPDGLERTVAEYNAAIQPGEYNPNVKDGKCTLGLTPPKTNWALPIDTPPYYGLVATGGITFTLGGLAVNTKAQVINNSYRPIPGLYAAGEILGDFFYYNYPGGGSLLRASVFGRIAAEQAVAEAAKAREIAARHS